MKNLVLILIILALVFGVVFYLYRAKKRGGDCLGCPHSRGCKGCCNSHGAKKENKKK